jgi:hypothetical protein
MCLPTRPQLCRSSHGFSFGTRSWRGASRTSRARSSGGSQSPIDLLSARHLEGVVWVSTSTCRTSAPPGRWQAAIPCDRAPSPSSSSRSTSSASRWAARNPRYFGPGWHRRAPQAAGIDPEPHQRCAARLMIGTNVLRCRNKVLAKFGNRDIPTPA